MAFLKVLANKGFLVTVKSSAPYPKKSDPARDQHPCRV